MNKSYLINKRFGKGIVLKQVDKPIHLKRNGYYWLVQCDCGETCIVDTTSLKKKWTNCGCVREPNLIGTRFSQGVVLELSHKYGGYKFWTLKCDCGKKYTAKTESLISNNTKSCGCLNKRNGKQHPRYKGYEDLAGDYWARLRRGAKNRKIDFSISIEFAWELFLKQNKKCALTGWDIIMGKGIQTASLDRIDSKQPYSESNIQWVHKDINRMKLNYEENYLFKICKSIINHRRLPLD